MFELGCTNIVTRTKLVIQDLLLIEVSLVVVEIVPGANEDLGELVERESLLAIFPFHAPESKPEVGQLDVT